MKRKLSLVMSLIMCLSWTAGCSEPENDSFVQERKSAAVSTEDENEDTTAADTTAPTETTAAVTTKEAPTEATKAAFENMYGFTRGTVDNGVYTSEFGKIRFQCPEGWNFFNDEQIATVLGEGLTYTGLGEHIDNEMLQQTTLYDCAVYSDKGESIVIGYENLAVTAGENAAFVTETAYIDIVRMQLETLMKDVTLSEETEPEKVRLGDQTFVKYTHKATYDSLRNVSVRQNYYVKVVDNYLIMVIMSSGHDCKDMSVYEKNFSKL